MLKHAGMSGWRTASTGGIDRCTQWPRRVGLGSVQVVAATVGSCVGGGGRGAGMARARVGA